MRYPGHIAKMAVLRETGFFSAEEIEVKGVKIRPIDVTAALMFPLWKLDDGEVDVTVMKIVVEGKKGGRRVRHTYDLYDRYDPETDTHSMARTTGYAATVAVRMLVDGLYKKAGISPPEFVGRDGRCVEFMLRGQTERGITYDHSLEELG